MYFQYIHKDTVRQETRRFIHNGVIATRDRCEKCGGLYPEVNHLDYSNPNKINFLCRRCHMLYHEYHADPVPGATAAVPMSLVRMYLRYRRIRAFWLYWVWYSLRYFHRRFKPVAEPIVINDYRDRLPNERIGFLIAVRRREQPPLPRSLQRV